jgi:hypothetical protein
MLYTLRTNPQIEADIRYLAGIETGTDGGLSELDLRYPRHGQLYRVELEKLAKVWGVTIKSPSRA